MRCSHSNYLRRRCAPKSGPRLWNNEALSPTRRHDTSTWASCRAWRRFVRAGGGCWGSTRGSSRGSPRDISQCFLLYSWTVAACGEQQYVTSTWVILWVGGCVVGWVSEWVGGWLGGVWIWFNITLRMVCNEIQLNYNNTCMTQMDIMMINSIGRMTTPFNIFSLKLLWRNAVYTWYGRLTM